MTDPTPLAEKLRRLIRATGPITVAEYMAFCLGDPEHGYYRHRDPLGTAGDFITAPEISQVFGELIGVWCVAVWEGLGRAPSLALAELGPGRGTLMADLLRAARIRPPFLDAAEIHLVETSPRLRAIQADVLAPLGKVPVWHESVATLPPKPLLLIANEFFDALPILQFVRATDAWAERRVGLDEEGRLAFGLAPLPDTRPMAFGKAEPGAVVELRPAGGAIMSDLARHIAEHGGAALVIDYGHAETGFGDTLQAVRGHRYDDPLAHPGEADLSAHVDFASLAAAASAAGAKPGKILTQAEFLARLGISARVDRLVQGLAPGEAEQIRGAAARLVDANEMGQLFKVLGVGGKSHDLPAFDTG